MSSLDFIVAADSVNMKAGGKSFWEDPGSAILGGVGGAVISGATSIYNTGIDFSNKLFGTDLEKASTGTILNSIDADAASYYETNKETIDTLGFVATSFIPGGLAIKGLKLAREGQAFGAFGRALGFASTRQANYLQAALREVATEGGSVFTRISANKAASMAWGAADQVLQAATFELATAITMKSSPMLEGKDWTDIGWDIAKTSLIGGAIGGSIEALFTNRIVKDAALLVDTKKSKFATVANTGDLSTTLGDKAYAIIDAAMAIPEASAMEHIIPFAKAKSGILDTGRLFQDTADKSTRHALLQFETAISSAVRGDPSVGRPLAEALLDMYRTGIKDGKSKEAIRQVMGDHLFGLQSVTAIGDRAAIENFSKPAVWLNPRGKIGDTANIVFGKDPIEKGQAFRLVGGHELSDLTLATTGTKQGWMKIQDIFDSGYDVALDARTHTLHVNPASPKILRINPDEAVSNQLYFNTTSKQTSFDVVHTAADMAPTGKPIEVSGPSVVAGSKSWNFTVGNYAPAENAADATARHLWASKLNQIDGTVNANDIAVMDRLLQKPGAAHSGLAIAQEGRVYEFANIDDFTAFAFDNKMSVLKQLLEESQGKLDVREIAYRLNMTPEFVDKAVSTGFNKKALFEAEGWARNLDEYGKRENLILSYNAKDLQGATFYASAHVAHAARIKEATQRVEDASKLVLGQDAFSMLLDFKGSVAGNATELGIGSSFVGSSNANYFDRAGVWAQDTGKNVALITQRHLNKQLATMQTPANLLRADQDAVNDVVSALTKLRTSTEQYSLFRDPVSGRYSLVDTLSFRNVRDPDFKGFATKIDLKDAAGDFLNSYHQLHAARVDKAKVLKNAQGVVDNWEPDVLHLPPVDTRKVPFFAFVRQQEGMAFSSSEVAMITAKDAADLKAKAAQIEKMPGFKVIYKADTEEYFKAKGDYDFTRTMNRPTIDPMLRKKGLLGDYLPSYNGEQVIEEFLQYTQRQETKLIRDAVSARYGQTIAELESLSQRATAAATSEFTGMPKWLRGTVADPYGDYIKTALNISKRSEFTLWHQANEFVDALGTRAFRGIEKATLDAQAGKMTWEDANKSLQKFGIGAHFTDEDAFRVAQTASDRNLIKTAIQKANMLIATGMLRLDFANSLMNVISTPIMLGTEVAAIRRSLAKDPEMFAKFSEALHIADPGNPGLKVPSTTKLIAQAIKNSFGKEGKALRERYGLIGALKDVRSQYHEMLDDLALLPEVVPSEYAKKVDKWVEKAASITFNNQAEDLTRFVSADVMRQITQPLVDGGRMSVTEQNAFMSIFVNRVQGNYIASQRPILFQGTIGGAIGLFQTYQFNLYQQLFRHIENKDMKTIAIMAGLQTSLYGLNGLPLFDAINTHVIGAANTNPHHKDIYSMAVNAAGKEAGDWLMYGTASALPLFSDQAPSLYTRGDLNPRSLTIVPVMPQDVPAYAAASKIVNNIYQMGSRLANGGDLAGTLLYGLEHNGINRPLAGLTQVLSGRNTTSKGDLISASADFYSVATLSRLIGSHPMDESIALNTVYRQKAYDAMDKAKIETLGAVIKEKLRAKGSLSADDWIEFQGQYASSGGRAEGFAAALQRWDRAANTSIVNEAMKHNNTAQGRRMIEVMGGTGLHDYNNTGVTEPSALVEGGQ